MTDSDNVATWARTLVEDNLAGRSFALPWDGEGPSIDEAYRIQDEVLAGLTDDRGPLGGYKVALTAKPMQEAMGLSEPLGGLVHAGQIHASPHELPVADLQAPAAEFEVAIRMGRDVPPTDQPYTIETIEPFVGEVITSFEIVDPRGAVFAEVGPAALIADRCACAGVVLGESTADWSDLDLGACPVELVWNGEVVETGSTGAAMGHPFAGLAWIANHLAGRGRTLDAGHVVLTGSAFAPKPIAAGDTITYRIAGIGEATITAP